MINSFRKTQLKPDSVDLKHVQDAVAQVFNQILQKQIIDGLYLENITITTGTAYSLSHGLGYDPRGWIVAKKNAEADVWQTVSNTPQATMILNSSADVTISLWVF